jgi:5-methyltetrahydropteroyltriglutamate--homocysteine methyltransferase
MKRSTDRILTTHVGSLVRTREIIEGMKARTLKQPYDEAKLEQDIRDGIREVVRKQVEIGVDIPSDGEYGRQGCHCYVHERLTGLELLPLEPGEDVWGAAADREQQKFPEFFEQYHDHFRYIWMHPEVDISDVPNLPGNYERFKVVGPIIYRGHAAVQRDIASFKAALQGLDVADAFITAATPTQRGKADREVLGVYKSEEEYLYALADAMNEEYTAIADAGFILQIDLGVLNPRRGLLQNNRMPTEADIARAMDRAVDVVNRSLRGIPEEKVRYHHCWGSMNSPHTMDAPLIEIVHHMLKIKAGAYVLEAANPRHEHEWMVWRDVKLPDGKILIPGIISHQTNVVEHPELVAWRIENYASVVGKENLIAGTDCGFSQYWDMIRVHPTVQWAKLQSLAEGAALASKRLWGR